MASLDALAQLLDASLDPRTNKEGKMTDITNMRRLLTCLPAELKIRAEEKKQGFALQLLQITATDAFSYNTRLSSALFFKNFIKRHWIDVEGNYKLAQQDVTAIKTEIIGLMTNVPTGIQTQLGEAISVIADSDFWERWETLVDDLVLRLRPDDLNVNIGVLQVAHSIFGRWRPLFRSDDLYTEINHVLTKFAQPFLSLWQSLDAYIEAHSNDKAALTKAFTELDLILKIFYDLSCHDLSPVFEDNRAAIGTILLKYLTYDNQLLHTDDESEAGPLENVKANVFEVLTLFVQKYYEDFSPQIPGFIQNSWALLTTTSSDPKNDILVSKALQFLTSVSRIKEQAQIFNDASIQAQIVEKVILPNVALRDSDIEMFEDEPIEFIRRDLEGSDSETRRRAATDFLKQLSDVFEISVTQITMSVIEKCLENYAKNPAENWRSKDTATNLFYATAAKGQATATHGVTKTNEQVNIGDFFSKNLAGDLQSQNAHPLLSVDAIKYLYVFRSIITPEQWQQVMSLLVNHLGNSNYCVYTYAAVTVERVLAMYGPDKKPVIDPASIVPLAKDLLEHLFSLIEKDPAPQKVQENEFLMRCIMRVLIVSRENVLTVLDSTLNHLATITNIIAPNPSNPRFYYYHFESLGALIQSAAGTKSSKLIDTLFNPFLNILQNSVEEFMPYVFQLLAALVEAEPDKPLPQNLQPLIAPVLMPTLWEQRGNVPALVRLLSALIVRSAADMQANKQIENVLGIFQKLLSSKGFESYAFELLETVVSTFPPAALEEYWVPILNIIFTRLQRNPPASLQLRFVLFYHFVAARDDKGLGADFFIAACDKVQPGQDIFKGLYLSIVLPKTGDLVRPLDRKSAAVALTKTLADSLAFVERYPKGWPLTCNTLLKLLENAPVVTKNTEDLVMEQDVEDQGFGVGFTSLTTIRKPQMDPYAAIGDLRQWVGAYLRDADGRHSGRIAATVEQGLGPDAKGVLRGYMGL